MVERPRCVIINGLPGSGKSTLARALAPRLGLPHLSKDAVKDLLADAWVSEPEPAALSEMGDAALWALLASTGVGGIVETWFGPTGAERVRAGLARAGVSEHCTLEVWCECPVDVARTRFQERMGVAQRHPRHDRAGRDDAWWDTLSGVEPLGVGVAVIRVDTMRSVDHDSLREQVINSIGI